MLVSGPVSGLLKVTDHQNCDFKQVIQRGSCMHSMACFVCDCMTVTDEPVDLHTRDVVQKCYTTVAVNLLVVFITHNYKEGGGVKFSTIDVTQAKSE